MADLLVHENKSDLKKIGFSYRHLGELSIHSYNIIG